MTIKRFYKEVSVVRDGDAFAVHLDGRPVRTPSREVLALPTIGMAQLVAEEWSAQENVVEPHAMPITRMTQSALDRGADDRAHIVDSIVKFAGSDLLCYRAEAPPELVALQGEQWDPILHWAAKTLGIEPRTTAGVSAIEQPARSLERLRGILDGLDRFELAGLQPAVPLLGSSLLGLALFFGEVDAARAHDLSLVDEHWQESHWGLDEEARERRQAIRRDLIGIDRYFTCQRDSSA